MTGRRLLGTLWGVATLLAAALGATPPAAAQDPGAGLAVSQDDAPPQPGSAEVVVESLSGALGAGDPFRLRVRVENVTDRPLSALRLVGTLHRRTYSRFDYQQAVEDGAVGDVWSSFGEDVPPLEPGEAVAVDLTREAGDLGFERPEDKYGVYPIRLQLLVDGTGVDDVVTSVVLAPDEVEQPVYVTMLWPVDAPPGLLPDGTYDDRLLDDLRARGRLTTLVEALDAEVPVTLAPAGLVLDQVADIADGFVTADGTARDADSREAAAAQTFLQRLEGAADRRDVGTIAQAHGPADLVALVRGGLHSEAARDIGEARSTIAETMGERPSPSVLWPPSGLDAETLRVATASGVDTVVLDESWLALAADRNLQWSPAPVRRLRWSGGDPLTAVVPDPWLSESLAAAPGEDGPAVAAQRVLAETAAVYFERPFAEERRGLVLAPPRVWRPDPQLPRTLLDGLGAASWLRPTTLEELVGAVPAAEDTVTLAYPDAARAAELPVGYVGALRDALVAYGSLATVLPGEAAPVSRFDTQLRSAASVHYRDDALRPEGRAKIDAVASTVATLYDAVEVVETPPVVLTSTEGQVPVTVASSADARLRVRVRLETARFAFEDGAAQEILLEPGEVRTLTFAAEALTAGGTSSVRVLVEDAAGGVVLTRGSVVVRSTAYSRVALAVTGAAAGFLLLWWVRDLTRRRGRGGHRHRDTEARAPASAGSSSS